MTDTWEIREGDVLDRLREMPDESVHCVELCTNCNGRGSVGQHMDTPAIRGWVHFTCPNCNGDGFSAISAVHEGGA